MVRSPIQQRFVDDQVGAALTRAGLPYDCPVRQTLNGDAEVIGPAGGGYLRMRDDRGELVSVDERIEQLRIDPAFQGYFPDLPKVDSGDEEQIRQNFDRIARGEVEVVK